MEFFEHLIRESRAVNDSLRDTDRPVPPWGLLRPAGTSLGLLRPAETGWAYTCNHLEMLSLLIIGAFSGEVLGRFR